MTYIQQILHRKLHPKSTVCVSYAPPCGPSCVSGIRVITCRYKYRYTSTDMANISLITQSNPFLIVSEFFLATAPIIFSAIKPFSRISSSPNILSETPDTITMSGKKTVAYFVNWVGFSDKSFTDECADWH